jgi:hypothetical protein
MNGQTDKGCDNVGAVAGDCANAACELPFANRFDWAENSLDLVFSFFFLVFILPVSKLFLTLVIPSRCLLHPGLYFPSDV